MAIEWQYREKIKDRSRGSISASSTVAGSAPLTSDEFDLFDRYVDLVCTDEHPSNTAAEKSIHQDRVHASFV